MWQHGIEAYIPEWNARYGESVNKYTADQISNSDLVLAVVTHEGFSRAIHMGIEVGYALAKGKQVIALVEEGVNTEPYLGSTSRIEFNRWRIQSYYDVAERVVELVKQQKGLKEGKEAVGEAVAGLALLGLFLWLQSRGGKGS